MDVLSEVLKVVKLQGALFYNGEFSSPWCVNATSSRALARHVAPTAEHVIMFHLLTEGRAFVRLESGDRETLNAGDLVMIPHGDPHVMGNGGSAKAVNDSAASIGKEKETDRGPRLFGSEGHRGRSYAAIRPTLIFTSKGELT